jgi:uncharacterized membrane protein YkoI
MQSLLSIRFSREHCDEKIEEFQAELDLLDSDLNISPKKITGKLTAATENDIIKMELDPDNVVVKFGNWKYKFQFLNRDRNFTLVQGW